MAPRPRSRAGTVTVASDTEALRKLLRERHDPDARCGAAAGDRHRSDVPQQRLNASSSTRSASWRSWSTIS